MKAILVHSKRCVLSNSCPKTLGSLRNDNGNGNYDTNQSLLFDWLNGEK